MAPEVMDVCRLCPQKHDLVSIFEKPCKVSEDIHDIIYTMVGVQITPEDFITQKVCEDCCCVVMKMYRFRMKSQRNDQKLKERWAKHQEKSNIPTNVQPVNSIIVTQDVNKRNAHPSVTEIFDTYPDIKLPRIILKWNMFPYVKCTMDEVETYYKKHNLDIQKDFRSARKAYRKYHSKIKRKNLINFPERYKIGNNIVSPISIRRDSKNSNYVIVDKERQNVTDVNANPTYKEAVSVLPNSSTRFIEPISECNNPISRKRKVSLSEDTTPTKKPAFFQALNLKPATKPQNENICNICQSIYHSKKELKTHLLTHFRCQFCQTEFKNSLRKNEHIETCVARDAIANPQKVIVTKTECDTQIKEKFPKAFAEFPPSSGVEEADDVCSSNPFTESTILGDIEHSADGTDKTTDIDPKNPTNLSKTNNIHDNINNNNNSDSDNTSSNILKPAVTNDNLEVTDLEVLKRHSHVQTTSVELGSFNGKLPTTEKSKFTDRTSMSSSVLSESSVVKHNNTKTVTPSSIIRPVVKITNIKNKKILDIIDNKATDLDILKELLEYRTTYKEKYTQTEFPDSSSIHVNTRDTTANIKNLKSQLNVFKVPIEIKHGSPFQVFYNYEKPSTNRKLDVWNGVAIIDIKKPTQVTKPTAPESLPTPPKSLPTASEFLPTAPHDANSVLNGNNHYVKAPIFTPPTFNCKDNSFQSPAQNIAVQNCDKSTLTSQKSLSEQKVLKNKIILLYNKTNTTNTPINTVQESSVSNNVVNYNSPIESQINAPQYFTSQTPVTTKPIDNVPEQLMTVNQIENTHNFSSNTSNAFLELNEVIAMLTAGSSSVAVTPTANVQTSQLPNIPPSAFSQQIPIVYESSPTIPVSYPCFSTSQNATIAHNAVTNQNISTITAPSFDFTQPSSKTIPTTCFLPRQSTTTNQITSTITAPPFEYSNISSSSIPNSSYYHTIESNQTIPVVTEYTSISSSNGNVNSTYPNTVTKTQPSQFIEGIPSSKKNPKPINTSYSNSVTNKTPPRLIAPAFSSNPNLNNSFAYSNPTVNVPPSFECINNTSSASSNPNSTGINNTNGIFLTVTNSAIDSTNGAYSSASTPHPTFYNTRTNQIVPTITASFYGCNAAANSNWSMPKVGNIRVKQAWELK